MSSDKLLPIPGTPLMTCVTYYLKPTSRVKSQQKMIISYYWIKAILETIRVGVSDAESLVLDSGEEVKLTESTESLWGNTGAKQCRTSQ